MASERGVKVHAYCVGRARDLFVPNIEDDCKGYYESFLKWYANVAEVFLSEKRLVHMTYRFLGHVDLVVRMKKEQFIRVVDLKTPLIHSRTWRGQISAYTVLVDKYLKEMGVKSEIKRSGTLQLDPKGKTPKYNEYTHSDWDFVNFLHALNAFWAYKWNERG